MRQILFELDLFRKGTPRASAERVLKQALNLLWVADQEYLRNNPNTPSIYASGVRYQREPLPDAIVKMIPPQLRAFLDTHPSYRPMVIQPEIWKAIPFVLRDRYADCEDLACARAAELNDAGIDARPDFDHRVAGGMLIYHIFVRLPNGQIEDPSRRLGMKGAA